MVPPDSPGAVRALVILLADGSCPGACLPKTRAIGLGPGTDTDSHRHSQGQRT